MDADLLARMRLFDRVMRDNRCHPADVAVAWALLWGFCNGDSGRCDPSANAIAARAQVDRRSVVRAIRHLEQLAYFQIDRLQGTVGKFGPTNTYKPVFDAPDTRWQPCHPMTPVPPGEGMAPMSPHDIDVLGGGGSPVTQTKEREPRKRLSRSVDTDPALTTQFETFWRAYPSRGDHSNPKKPARAKFEAAIRGGVYPEAIIRGAVNYGAYVAANVTDRKYVAQAVTWLNQERWNEYQEPPRRSGTSGFTYGHQT